MFTVYIVRGVQRRCVWAVGWLGIADCLACVAVVVDRHARQSCRVWCGGVNHNRRQSVEILDSLNSEQFVVYWLESWNLRQLIWPAQDVAVVEQLCIV